MSEEYKQMSSSSQFQSRNHFLLPHISLLPNIAYVVITNPSIQMLVINIMINPFAVSFAIILPSFFFFSFSVHLARFEAFAFRKICIL